VTQRANTFYYPEDIGILRDALDHWCVERHVDIKSAEAQFAATAALGLFQSGHDTSEKLLAALREHRAL
jgi:GTP cyclohydrolase I